MDSYEETILVILFLLMGLISIVGPSTTNNPANHAAVEFFNDAEPGDCFE